MNGLVSIRSSIRIAFLMFCVLAAGCAPSEAQLTIDPQERHQVMRGWEVTTRGWEFDKANNRFDGSMSFQRDELAAMLVDQAGIDRLRLEIKSGIEKDRKSVV